MKWVPLTNGGFTAVSDRDYWLARQFTWSGVRRGRLTYAQASIGISLHRLLAGFPPFDIDHRNRNGLDNRRSNLRVASESQNLANSALYRNSTSKRKGVSWHKRRGKWQAQIGVANRRIYLGLFSSKARAASAYTKAARKYFGKFARFR